MAVELRVPEVGESITEVQIGTWLKNEGDAVERDEALVEIESDKATLELPAPVSGTLSQVLKKKGESAKVGDLIATIGEGRGAKGAKAPAAARRIRAAPRPSSAPAAAPEAAKPAPLNRALLHRSSDEGRACASCLRRGASSRRRPSGERRRGHWPGRKAPRRTSSSG